MSDLYKGRGKGLRPVITIDWEKFALDLRKFRSRKKISCRQFADMSGISFSSISKLELGRSHCSAEAFFTIVHLIDADAEGYVIRNFS